MNYMLFSSIDANFKFIINENNLFHTCYIYFYSLKCAFTYTINFKIIIIFYNYENIEDNSQLKSLYDITRNVRLWWIHSTIINNSIRMLHVVTHR